MTHFTHMNRAARLALVALAGVVGAAAFALAGAPDAQAIDTSRVYRITTFASLALDVERSSKEDGARVLQWGANGGRNQLWRFESTSSAYRIVNVNSGKCLAVQDMSAGSGIVQADCGSATALWTLPPFLPFVKDSYLFDLKSKHSGLRLDVPNTSVTWGTQLIQWSLADYGAHQTFAATPIDQLEPYRKYRLTTSNSLALDVQGGSTANDARVIQWPINGGRNQAWRFYPVGDGTYQIVNENSGRCLTIGGNSLWAGAGIVQYACGAAPNQRWTIMPYADHLIRLKVASSNLWLDVPGASASWGTQLVQWYDGTWVPNQVFAFTALA